MPQVRETYLKFTVYGIVLMILSWNRLRGWDSLYNIAAEISKPVDKLNIIKQAEVTQTVFHRQATMYCRHCNVNPHFRILCWWVDQVLLQQSSPKPWHLHPYILELVWVFFAQKLSLVYAKQVVLYCVQIITFLDSSVQSTLLQKSWSLSSWSLVNFSLGLGLFFWQQRSHVN